MRPTTFLTRAALAALVAVCPVVVVAGPASAAPPVSVDDQYTMAEDTVLSGENVLANDVDPEGDVLTVVVVSDPTDGYLTLEADGDFSYEPRPNSNGIDSFTYRASDATSSGDVVTVTITVMPVPDPIDGVSDSYATGESTRLTEPAPGLLGNDRSPDRQQLFVAMSTATQNGTVTVAPDGSFVYDPDPGFWGVDSFSYVATDGVTSSPAYQVTIVVGNVPPVAEPDAYFLDEDTTLTAAMLANDTDVNGDMLGAVLVSGPSNGTLVLDTSNGVFEYTPSADFNGVDSFIYQASDGTAVSAPATVTLSVNAMIDRPTFDPSVPALSAVEDTPYTGQVTAGNIDGRPLTYTASTTGTPTGSVVMDPITGAFTFTPERNFVGLAQLDVFACDTLGYCASQLVNITVNNVPDAPVANDQSVTASQGAAVTAMFDVWDIDSPVLTFTVTSAPQRGTVTIDPDMWTFTYTPTAGTSGTDTFTVDICDADGLCASTTVTIAVAQSAVLPADAPTPTPTLATPAVVPAPATGADTLPVTGGDVTALALGALGMVALGCLFVARASRRHARA